MKIAIVSTHHCQAGMIVLGHFSCTSSSILATSSMIALAIYLRSLEEVCTMADRYQIQNK